MHQQLWGYKVEDKIYLGACERKRLNITAVDDSLWKRLWTCRKREYGMETWWNLK